MFGLMVGETSRKAAKLANEKSEWLPNDENSLLAADERGLALIRLRT